MTSPVGRSARAGAAARADGRVALVTGAAHGIGAAVAQSLAEEGASVVLNDKNADAVQALAVELTAAGRDVLAVPGDVADRDQVHAMVDAAMTWRGRLDLAYNNAAVPGVRALTGDYPDAVFWRVLQVNLGGVLNCVRAEVPAMLRGGGGAIVNATSAAVSGGVPESVAYAASKHAVVGLTKTAALEYAARGVRINAIAPGLVATGFVGGVDQEMFAAAHPVGRMGTAAEVAAAVCWLLSPSASFVTGTVLGVDGGLSARVAGL